jgi:hypothetical protein
MRREFKPKENTAIQDLQEQLQATQDAINYILMSSADTSAVDDTSTTTTDNKAQ